MKIIALILALISSKGVPHKNSRNKKTLNNLTFKLKT